MWSIIYFFIVELLILTLLNSFGPTDEIISITLILAHSIFVILILFKKYKKFSVLLSIGYLLRLFSFFWDIYARNIFVLIGSGADSEGFYRVVVNISKNIYLLRDNLYGGLYTKFLGSIAYFIGPDRLILQYINVILGLFIMIISLKILQLLFVELRIVKQAMLFIVLMPMSVIHSAILLRENFITFLILVALYFFIKWFNNGRVLSAIISILFILLASILHSGVIGLLSGMTFTFIFYNFTTQGYDLRLKNFLTLGLFFLVGILMFIKYNDVFLQKFSSFNNVDYLVSTSTIGRGGSQYLTSFNISGPFSLLLFTPIKIFYFLTSPLPPYWRGFGDLISFLIDGLVYLYLISSIMNHTKKKEVKPIEFSMLISIFVVLTIFGIGINNAGTAMRHRNKIFEYLVIFWAYSISDGCKIEEVTNEVCKKNKNIDS